MTWNVLNSGFTYVSHSTSYLWEWLDATNTLIIFKTSFYLCLLQTNDRNSTWWRRCKQALLFITAFIYLFFITVVFITSAPRIPIKNLPSMLLSVEDHYLLTKVLVPEYINQKNKHYYLINWLNWNECLNSGPHIDNRKHDMCPCVSTTYFKNVRQIPRNLRLRIFSLNVDVTNLYTNSI